MERLIRLYDEFGQSPWLDNLTRGHLHDGSLDALIGRGVRGLTSNPTIFQKAIGGSAAYDEQFRALVADGRSLEDVYWALVVEDIHGALDAFAPLYSDSSGADGFVSVEVDPGLAHDGPRTEVAARGLHQRIDRPNLMVKIPATREGLPAIQQMIAEGRSVNVTLIFGLERYQRVMDAYLAGLEEYVAQPDAEPARVASVASFFISRVDTEIDRRLTEIGSPEALALCGTAAVAQARLAYRQFLTTFHGPRWDALAARGARVQRPLWASTSTKNPAYRDTLYVDELIGPLTVNTLPDATLEAFADHGALDRRIDADLDEAMRIWDALAAVGVDLDDVAAVLEQQGVAAFQQSFDELMEALRDKAVRLDPSSPAARG